MPIQAWDIYRFVAADCLRAPRHT